MPRSGSSVATRWSTKGETKRGRARPLREKKLERRKGKKVALSQFFFHLSRPFFFFLTSTSFSLFPHHQTHHPQKQASPAEAVKDAVEAVKDAVEDVKDAVVHAVEEATAEAEEEPEAAAPVEVKVQTSPHDARFPATNQSRHCYTRYNEYYRCVAQKGEEDEECKFVSDGGGFF